MDKPEAKLGSLFHSFVPGRIWKAWWHLFRMWNRPAPAPEYGLGWRDRVAARGGLARTNLGPRAARALAP